MKNNVLRVGVCCLLFVTIEVLAQTSIDYFKATIPVKSQGVNARSAAASEGLEEVLVRVSGNPSILSNPQLTDKIKRALNYVNEFQYRENTDKDEFDEGYEELLVVSFAPSVIERMIINAGEPFWSTNRPETLVWLVEDSSEFGRQLQNHNSETLVTASLAEAAQARGIPLVYPLLDLDDHLVLPVERAWQLDEIAVLEASERYDAAVILIGRYTKTSAGDVISSWQFFHAGESRSIDSRQPIENDQILLGVDVIDPLADFLARKYATVKGGDRETSGLVMELSGVHGFGHYSRALDYLESLSAVEQVAVVAVRGQTLTLQLTSDSQIDQLADIFALNNKLIEQKNDQTLTVPQWEPVVSGTWDNPLRYRWAGK